MAENLRWQPSASIDILQRRAQLMQNIRRFFDQRDVLEVETPVLSQFGGTDVQLQQWQTVSGHSLHTSPEFAMKRLLAAGSGDIFQLCRVFRQDESGQRHNPEFTMLEWYRLGFDEFQLMAEVVELMAFLAGEPALPTLQMTYREAFSHAHLPDPMASSTAELRSCITQKLGSDALDWSRDDCLDALMALVVEPALPSDTVCFVHQYPASQAALARHQTVDGYKVARRFECYWRGMELANGYFELTDPAEQQRRFEQDNVQRRQSGLPEARLDEHFLQALRAGMPDCAGVALGVDRLIMILLQQRQIADVVAFDFSRS